ncbi:MAG: hypothetical protein HY904_10825, partial [Deltaproteobacteria bacterium]|nr:hypothetical protein [Deltaproteobacteria bacterium]
MPVLIQRFLARKLKSGLAPQTVEHFRRTLRAMFNKATTWELFVGKNPAVAVDVVVSHTAVQGRGCFFPVLTNARTREGAGKAGNWLQGNAGMMMEGESG